MSVLYLHGYGGSPNQEKLRILSKNFSNVIAPQIDYDDEHFLTVIDKALAGEHISYLVGNSLGGVVAHYYARKLGKPCLLLNPAFCSSRADELELPKLSVTYNAPTYVVLGGADELLPPEENIVATWALADGNPLFIRVRHSLPHSVPADVFANEVDNFKTLIHLR